MNNEQLFELCRLNGLTPEIFQMCFHILKNKGSVKADSLRNYKTVIYQSNKSGWTLQDNGYIHLTKKYERILQTLLELRTK